MAEKGEKRRANGQFAKGHKGGPGRPRKTQLRQQPRQDDFINAITGLGQLSYDKRQYTTHSTGALSDEAAADLWEGNPLAARIVETWPDQMLREGYDLIIGDTGSSPESGRELSERVEARIEELAIDETLWTALAYERAYGGAAALLGANDGASLESPLRFDRVLSLDWLTSFEPREIRPSYWYQDPRSPGFGKPSHYDVVVAPPGPGRYGAGPPQQFTVHESRLIIFPGIRVSRRQSRGQHPHWGGSILTRVWSILRDHGMGFDAAAVLLNDFAQTVYQINGLAQASVEDLDDQIQARIKAIELSRSLLRAVVIDGEEKFGRQQTPVTGMPELLDRLTTMLAAAADMPLTLLMGQSPSGLNATGESDIRFFYDRVRAAQSKRLRPILEKITRLVFRDLDVAEPEKWKIEFRPLWQQSDKDKAEARHLQAKTDEVYVNTMVLSPEDVARSRFGGDGYSFETSVDFAARAKLEEEQRELDRMAQEQSIASAQAASGELEPEPEDTEE